MIGASRNAHPSPKDTAVLLSSFLIRPSFGCYLKACVICVGGSRFVKKEAITHPSAWATTRTQSADLLCSSGKRNGSSETGSGCDIVVLVCSVAFSSYSVSALLCLLLIQRTFLETAFRHQERDADWSRHCFPSQSTGLL